jgi:hypothetical protein
MKTDVPAVKYFSALVFVFLIFSSLNADETRFISSRKWSQTPFLGISMTPLDLAEYKAFTRHRQGIYIDYVIPETAAARGGLKKGDIILTYNDAGFDNLKKAEMVKAFSRFIKEDTQPGVSFALQILRLKQVILSQLNHGDPIEQPFSEVEQTIKELNLNDHFALKVDKSHTIFKLALSPAKRPKIRSDAPPANAVLYPEFEKTDDLIGEMIEQSSIKFEFEDDYQDLMARFADNEWWEDPFRFSLFRYLHRDPVKIRKVSKHYSDLMLRDVSRNEIPLLFDHFCKIAGCSTPDYVSEPFSFPTSNHPDDHLDFIVETLSKSNRYRELAFRDISLAERAFLSQNAGLIPDQLLESFYFRGEKQKDFETFLRILDIAARVHFDYLFLSGKTLANLSNPTWLSSLQTSIKHSGIVTKSSRKQFDPGKIILEQDSPIGKIIIADGGNNFHRVNATVIIDIGGMDRFLNTAGGATYLKRAVSVDIYFDGNDSYASTEPHSQGSGFLGNGLLIDLKGNDRYLSTTFGQGAGYFGTGLLVDFEGDDSYSGASYVQASGLFGVGLLIDYQGNDQYRADEYSQGTGMTYGFGSLFDLGGHDIYIAGQNKKSSYRVKGVFKGASQGFGFGIRNHTSGGLGILIDQKGRDHFSGGNFSQGGGYFFGMGWMMNYGEEDDLYEASRYGIGFSAHSAIGSFYEEGGNDTYTGSKAARSGAAWDLSASVFVDQRGNDTYQYDFGSFDLGSSAHNGFGLFMDLSGKDRYAFSPGTRAAISGNSYHGGTSFSLFLDQGHETDIYPGTDLNNSYTKKQAHSVTLDNNQAAGFGTVK